MNRIALLVFAVVIASAGGLLADNEDIEDEAGRQMGAYDFTSWQEALDYVESGMWGADNGESVENIILRYTAGAGGIETEGIFDGIWASIAESVKSNMAILAAMLGVAILSGLVRALAPDGKSISELTSLICVGIAISLIVAQFSMTVARTETTLDRLKSFEETAIPTLLIMLTAVGSTTAGAAYGPVSGLLSGAVIGVLRGVVLPIVLLCGVLGLINGLTERARLKRLYVLAKSAAKWITGIVSTVYFGVLAVQGIAASTYDSVSIRTAKYAISSMVPVLGGMVSGSVDTVLGCGVLLKNAAGVTAILIAVALVYEQLVSILGLIIICRVAAAMCDAMNDERLPVMLGSLAESAGLLFSIVIAAGAMFAITVGLVVATGNMIIFGG